MLLRPYYPENEKLFEKINCTELVSMLLAFRVPNLRKKILRNLGIRQLVVILHGLIKDEKTDEFLTFNTLGEEFESMWIDIIEVLNSFPCIRLVDSYTKTINTTDGNNFDSFELSIDSDEYDFLLEYLLEVNVNNIIFPLIEIKTKKFNKIYEVLEHHCAALKIHNDNLSVIKDSQNFKNKLKILTLVNYEHFETVEKLTYETLNVIGNEIDLFSISTLIKKNSNLKNIYFNGRLKDYVPLNIDEKLNVYYDLIEFNAIDNSQLKELGSLKRINSLHLNFSLESNTTLEWLINNCQNLQKLYLSLNYVCDTKEVLSKLKESENLQELTLKNYKIEIDQDKIQDFNNSTNIENLFPQLKILTLIECDFDSTLINYLNNSSLLEICLVQCDLNFNSLIKLPRTIKKITIINQDVDLCKDFVFLSYKVRSSFCYSINRTCVLNINEKLMTMRIADNHDLWMTRVEKNNDSEKKKFLKLKIPYNSSINFTIFPNFNQLDFTFLNEMILKFKIFTITIELYSFTNVFLDPIYSDNIENVKIYHFDIIKQQEYLKKILSKKELNKEECTFFLPFISSSRSLRRSSGLYPLSSSASASSSSSSSLASASASASSSSYTLSSLNLAGLDSSQKMKTSIIHGRHDCRVCGKHFSRRTALNRHMLVHKNHRPFKCGKCGYCFKRSDHLKVHQKVCV